MENTTQNKQEIITLIGIDMRNRKLVMGLEQAGLHAENFYSDLTEIILRKMGFDETSDDIYNWYQETMEELINVNVAAFMAQEKELALKMHEQLIFQRLING